MNIQEGKAQKQEILSVRMKAHTFFLKILSWKEATMEFEMGYTERLGRRQLREKMNSHKKFEGKLKKILKTSLTVQNTRFSRLRWAAR